MFLLMSILLTVTILAYLYLTRNHNYWKKLGVPYSKPILLLGSLLPLARQKVSRGDFFRNMYLCTTHPYYGFFTLTKPSILLRDPNLIKNMLIKDFESFPNRNGGAHKDDITSHALFFLKDNRWKRMRSQLTPLFSSGKLKHMFPFLNDVGENLVKYITNVVDSQKSIDCMNIMCMYNTDIIATCFFGFTTEALNNGNQDFHLMSLRLFNPTITRILQVSCISMLPKLASICRMKVLDSTSQNFLQNIFLQVFKQRRESSYVRGDLVDLLIKIQEEDMLSYEDVYAQPLQFHFAGFDTTCNTIAFTLIELCSNPKVQIKLRKEINETLTKYGSLSYDALQEMNYLNMVVSESLRIHPIVPVLDRICTKSYKMPDSNLVIEEGTNVVVSIQGIHRDGQYFENPEKFDPERFSQTNKSKIISGTYIPFGDGPRNCIGLRFALLSAKVALVKIVGNFEIELGETLKTPISYDSKYFFTTPRGRTLDLKFKPLNDIRTV